MEVSMETYTKSELLYDYKKVLKRTYEKSLKTVD